MDNLNIFNSDMFPLKGRSDEKADEMRQTILDSESPLPETVTGRIWYISSNSGSDGNSGKAKNQAWETIAAIDQNADKIKAGDAVLFERDCVYRGSFRTKSGVYYGAYGNGYKPCIYGSKMNYARENCWEQVENNIWLCKKEFQSDVGIIVFNHGRRVGFKKPDKVQLKVNGDFWCDGENGFALYICMDKNPGEKFESIEIGERMYMIGIYDNSENVIIDNLCLRYSGSHAIAGCDVPKNVTVRNCEVGFIGGSYLGGHRGKNVRFGNAIEFYGECENITVENNWVYQIYDSGVTHQGAGSYVARNIRIANNLIEYCGMGSYEYWLWYDKSKGDINYAENVTFENNICRFAGYCWGGNQRPDKVSAHILSNGPNHNRFINYIIRGNIFDQSTQDLVEVTSLDETYPVMEGNTYIQKEGLRLGSFANSRDIIFDCNVEKVITEDWGDKSPTVIFE